MDAQPWNELTEVLCRKIFSSLANKASSVLLFSLFLCLNSPLIPSDNFHFGSTKCKYMCIWDAIMCVVFIKPGGGDGIFDSGLFILIDSSEKVAGLGGDLCFLLTRNSKDQLGQKISAVMWHHCRQQFYGNPRSSIELVRKINPSLIIPTCKGRRILRNNTVKYKVRRARATLCQGIKTVQVVSCC